MSAHLRLLPVQARVIGRAGVEIAGLTYDSPALDGYRQPRSPLQAFDGKWPIRVDPRDLGRVWFQDPRDACFHELPWRHARKVARPFGGSALGYVKRLVVDSGMRRPSEGLNRAILTFHGMGPPKRTNTRELTQLVLECARCCQTSLVVIDDIHLLELRREADRDANNHLKPLANDLQATFVYAGVGLSHGGFMHEGLYGADAALAQISQRFKRLPVKPLRRSTQAERELWLGVLQMFEQELVLLQAKDGDLTGQADCLWRRTQGVIGSLTPLLTEATTEAIDTGSARITRKLLDGINVGYAAEVGAGRQQPQQAAA